MTAHADWALAALSLASCWLMGSKRRGAWLLAVVTNLAGAAYFAREGLDGLVALEAAFVGLNARGWWRWAPEPTAAPPLAELLDHHASRRAAARHALNARIAVAATREDHP